MTSRSATAIVAVMIAIGGALLYLPHLGDVPPYLIHDEAQGALQAKAIASTGRDLNGRLLPMYFTEPEFPPGRDPVEIYVTALGLKLLPFSDAGARTPTTLIAVLDIVLMFFAARAIFGRTWAGVLAATLIALTPIHLIRGRLLLSPLYSIPFIVGWLWALARFDERPAPRRFIAACVTLALGMYSYLAAVVMMPLYLLMTIAVAARSLRWRSVFLAAVVFVICMVPMGMWYVTHPERNAQIVSQYQLGGGAGESVMASLVTSLGHHLNLYWVFFDPAYLFVSGDSSLVNSTRTSGLFPYAFALLLPIGVVAAARAKRPIGWVLIAGLLTAPVVSVISGAIEMNRVMFAIPFATLVASCGAITLFESKSIASKVLGALLVASIGWQFTVFYRDYMSDSYRMRSATWFSGNPREALREAIARAGNGPVYISTEIDWVHRFWRFYAIEAGRLDLVDHTTYFRDPPRDAPDGATLVCEVKSANCAAVAASGAWRSVATVPSMDGSRRYAIMARGPAPAGGSN
jgi:4-amino-4-deoxy-L-arabinose transferase-like glycosyltransferase